MADHGTGVAGTEGPILYPTGDYLNSAPPRASQAWGTGYLVAEAAGTPVQTAPTTGQLWPRY